MIITTVTPPATVGNRVLAVQIGNGSAPVFMSQKSGNIAASAKGTIVLAPALPSGSTAAASPMLDGTTPGVAIYGPIPPLMLPAGYTIKVYDVGAIDAAADDMTVALHYIEYNAEDFA